MSYRQNHHDKLFIDNITDEPIITNPKTPQTLESFPDQWIGQGPRV